MVVLLFVSVFGLDLWCGGCLLDFVLRVIGRLFVWFIVFRFSLVWLAVCA